MSESTNTSSGEKPSSVEPLTTENNHPKPNEDNQPVLSNSQVSVTLAKLDSSINSLQVTAATMPGQMDGVLQRLSDIKLMFLGVAASNGSQEDFEQLVTSSEALLKSMLPGDTRQGDLLATLGQLANRRYNSRVDILHLSQAIKRYEESVLVTPAGHDKLHSRWLKLTMLYHTRFTVLGAISDLKAAIQFVQKALALGQQGDDTQQEATRYLIICMGDRYGRLGDLDDLGVAIQLGQELLATATEHRGSVLNNLSNHLCNRYRRLGHAEDLAMAVQRAEEAVACTAADDPDIAGWLCTLSSRLAERYRRFGAQEDLNLAILHAEAALNKAAKDSPHRATMLNNLSSRLSERYGSLGDLVDLDGSIERAKESVEATPPGHPSRPNGLQNLSSSLGTRFERLGSLDDLSDAVKLATEAVSETPVDDTQRPARLMTLSNQLCRRYERLGNANDLNSDIKLLQEAADLVPPEHIHMATISTNLCARLSGRYAQQGNPDDISTAIQWGKGALIARPPGHPMRADSLNNLATAFAQSYYRLGNIDDLNVALKLAQEAVTATPAGHPNLAGRLANLGVYFSDRFKRLDDLGDLTLAITRTQEALAATELGHSDRPQRLSNLGTLLLHRFQRLGDPEDIAVAIRFSKEAVDATPVDSPGRAGLLNNLAILLSERHSLDSRVDDLTAAIAHIEEADRVGHTEHQDDSSDRALNLSGMFLDKYKGNGNLDDLSMAINWAEKSVATTSPGHPSRPGRLRNASLAFSERYKRFGSLDDIAVAIKRAEEAVAETPPDHPERPSVTSTLGNLYCKRWERLRSNDDLRNAIQWAEEAVKKTPADHPQLAPRLCNLSNTLSHTGELADLNSAIIHIGKALKATPQGHPNRAAVLDSFGNRLCSVNAMTKTTTFLDKALGCYFEAVKLTSPMMPAFGLYQLHFGTAAWAKYNECKELNYLYHASRVTKSAWECTAAGPHIRLHAANFAVLTMMTMGLHDEAGTLLEEAINLLPRLSPRTLQALDHQQNLSIFSSLASYAGSVALMTGKDAAHSLNLLELGRGIIAGRSIDNRSDVSELKRHFPLVHDRFNDLRTALDYPPSATLEEATYEKHRDQRNRVAQELDQTLSEIRLLPGFDKFQLSPSPEELMKIASEGPIVVVNCTPYHGDAIIVTHNSITSVRLPTLKSNDVVDRMKKLRSDILPGRRSTYTHRNRQLLELLLWLWDEVVEPVCNELSLEPISGDADGVMPHIWWIGVGPLAMAPFHAAGDHSIGSIRNMFSRAVSSYTPTIKALSFARESMMEVLQHKNPKILLVTMPDTPGHPSLRQVTEEANLIASVAPNEMSVTFLKEPSAEEVLEALPLNHVVHFACHGIPDANNPSNSSLLLTKAAALDRLTVGAISSKNMRGNAQIAYLSACSTAVNAAEALQNESIHIASGFQLAGFSHVLGTLWAAQDTAAQTVAVEFYRQLFASGGTVVGHSKVSQSFHHAIKSLREKKRNQPILWAPFIHNGA